MSDRCLFHKLRVVYSWLLLGISFLMIVTVVPIANAEPVKLQPFPAVEGADNGSGGDGGISSVVDDGALGVGRSLAESDLKYGLAGGGGEPSSSSNGVTPDVYVTSRALGTNSKYTCEDLPEDGDASAGTICNLTNMGCGLMDTVSSDGEGYLTSERVRVDTQADSEELLGFDCTARGGGGGPAEGSEPVVITITRSDFESMEVEPLVASAGPEDGWLPVNMVNVLYAKSESQTLATEVLGVPVSVRAVPVSYHWDLGDGNTITTTNAGEPFPSEAVSGTYRYEGWYDVTLTTTFSGQFSVAGGPWQDIDGTIEVASDPIPVYSKSLESRLVDGDVPVDENEDPWVPERTAETEGPQDPAATHRET